MKKLILCAVSLLLFILPAAAQQYSSIWQLQEGAFPSAGERLLHPDHYRVFSTSEGALRNTLFSLSANPGAAQFIDLPQPDGTYRTFKIWETPMMEEGLATRYPGIRTFTAEAADNHGVTAKIDYTPFGFHAFVFDGSRTYLVDPASNVADGYYLSYYKKDYSRPAGTLMVCGVHDPGDEELGAPTSLTRSGMPNMQYRLYGTTRKTYRLALACTGEYAVAVAGPIPTKAAVLAKMVTSVNRVSGVYEREFAVTLQLIANDDTLIYLSGASDPYTNNNGGTMLGQNQTTINTIIGSANYDIGHVFSTGGGGIATKGCVCKNNSKAQGVTGSSNPQTDAFDIDYVAHEMGHQFGADHTFNNNNSGSCSGNAVQTRAYEPGSGSTIMAYAGICGGGNDYQQHSDAYFHFTSLEQISNYLVNGTGGGACGTTAVSPNTNATLPAFSATYNIPFLTPFELTAPAATDATRSELTYCWEERDLGDFGSSLALTRLAGPLFRSFNPDTSATRVFPKLTQLLQNITSYNAEKLPDTGRLLRFKMTERDVYQGYGCFNFPDDTIRLQVIHTGTPFAVTAPNTSAVTWIGNWGATVTWNISQTNIAPISCDNVNIYLSVDSGYTYPYLLKANTPNDGSENIVVPAVNTGAARVKVKGAGNVFFDISNENFTIITWPAGVGNVPGQQVAIVSPVPARESVTVRLSDDHPQMQGSIVNAVGQVVWSGRITKEATIPVGGWAKGIYYLRLADETTRAAQPLAVQ